MKSRRKYWTRNDFRIKNHLRFCLVLVVTLLNAAKSNGQCAIPPKLSCNQCSNTPLSFDSYDSTITTTNWFINKVEIDSFPSELNLGNFSATIGAFTGVTLLKEDSNWYGFYNDDTPSTLLQVELWK